ncbi:carbohydrate ABC transporter permease [Geminicoccus flavidas]|uniref:carbohydrate ABC transporter permease n=1 Tax=Geminicoccus flavidas TaxID=2506407 RepID=UPI00190F8910|nr:sugar ABC transporter permease [Geminicoccus flavidas]
MRSDERKTTMLDRTRTLPALLLILPSLALSIWIIGYPIYDVVYTSLHEVNRFGRVRDFAGLTNFAKLFADPIFIASLWRTVLWTATVVGGAILLSIPIAVMLNEDFYGRGIARVIVMLPWAISLAMTAIVWRWSLNGQYGMINATLFQLGILDGPVEWLASFDTAFPIEIAIGILVSIPFTATVLLGGLSSIPADVYEAATIDGATGWQRFRYMTLPLMKPFLQIAIVLNVINVFNSFPIIWVLTQGEPANSTDILVTYLYKLAFRYGRLDTAAAMSLIMFAILLVFTAAYIVLARRSEEKGA